MKTGSGRRAPDFGPILLTAASVAFLLAGSLGGSATDDEEYRNVVVSLILHARAIFDGAYPFWTSDLGFGMPHPLHPAFTFHPLMPLFGLVAPGTALRAFYALHAGLGAWGCWRLVSHLTPGRWIAALAASTWVLATPALDYSLADLWPSHFFGWSLFPWLVLYLRRILDDGTPGQPWRRAVALGLLMGLVGANGHFGQVPVLILPLVLMCAFDARTTLRRLPALVAAAAIGVCIALPPVIQLMQELRYFPDIPRDTVSVPIGPREFAGLLLRPLIDIRADGSVELGEFGALTPFFGGPMFALALAAVAGLRPAGRAPLGLAAAFVGSFVVLFWPVLDRELTSGRYEFRDALSLFGIALGSLALAAVAGRRSRLALGIGVAQMAVLIVSAWPLVHGALESRGAERRALQHTPLTIALREWAGRLPGRWYVAPELDALIRQGSLQDDGLWRDVWVYRGLPIVNGAFKGVSADPLYPSGSLPIGRIQGDAATVRSAATLGVLGIGAVLATAAEPVAPELQELQRFEAQGTTIRLLRHAGAWAGGALLPADVLATTPPELPDCRFRGLLCRDFTRVAAGEADPGVRLIRRHGVLDAQFAPGAGPRVLLLPEMFRPGWHARGGGGNLEVTAAWNGLVAVRVPAGIAGVVLRYRPPLVMAATAASALTILAAVVTLVWRRRRDGARA